MEQELRYTKTILETYSLWK